jgi:hypothetical protein
LFIQENPTEPDDAPQGNLQPTDNAPTNATLLAMMLQMQQTQMQMQQAQLKFNQELLELQKSKKRSLPDPNDDDASTPPNVSDIYIAMMAIFFASFDPDSGTITPALVLPSFSNALRLKGSAAFSAWSRSFHDVQNAAVSNTHFIPRSISMSFLPNSALLTFFYTGDLLDSNLKGSCVNKELTSRVGLLHFGPPNTADLTYTELKDKCTLENAEARLQQADRHLSKRNTKLFHATLFDHSLSHLVSTIANFFTFAKAIVPTASYDYHEDNPYILNTLARIAAVLVNPKVVQNVQVLGTQHPHLLHSIYTMMHDVFAAAAELIRGNDNINAYLQAIESTGSPTDCMAPGSFDNLVYISEEVLRILEGLESCRANYGSLTNCPPSYGEFHSTAPALPLPTGPAGPSGTTGSTNPNGGKKARTDEQRNKPQPHAFNKKPGKGGWLTFLPGVKWGSLQYTTEDIPFCLRHAVSGSTCPNGNNCARAHMGFSDLASATQEALTAYVKSKEGAAVCSIAP